MKNPDFPIYKIDGKIIFLGIAHGFVAYLLNVIAGFFYLKFVDSSMEWSMPDGYFFVSVFLIFNFFVAPFFEESFFRGYLQGVLSKKLNSKTVGILTTNLIWCFLHISSGIRTPIVLFLPGIVFSLGQVSTKSTFTPIIAHMIMNILVTITLMIYIE